VPDSGRVVFDGIDLAALSAAQRSKLRLRRFGFVFQFGDLVPELSLVENVELPLRFAGMGASEARRHAFDALELTGIGGLADRRIFEVSGGEQQRAAVARALVHSPDIVFADEPTGALDEENGALVLELFLAAARARAASVVMATHNPAIALGATRRVALRAGNVEITA
jgi:putative ABC transport system ATP-binding protein